MLSANKGWGGGRDQLIPHQSRGSMEEFGSKHQRGATCWGKKKCRVSFPPPPLPTLVLGGCSDSQTLFFFF